MILIAAQMAASAAAPVAPVRRSAAYDDTRADWRPWCWPQIERALADGPRCLGQLAASCYGDPVTPADRNAMHSIAARCLSKGLVQRVGYGRYALPAVGATPAAREGTYADLVVLLERSRAGGRTVRHLAYALNVLESRVHGWLGVIRADPALAPRLVAAPARVRGRSTRVYWLEPSADRGPRQKPRQKPGPKPGMGRPRFPCGEGGQLDASEVYRATVAVLADGPRTNREIAARVYGVVTPATLSRVAANVHRYCRLGRLVQVGPATYALAEGV